MSLRLLVSIELCGFACSDVPWLCSPNCDFIKETALLGKFIQIDLAGKIRFATDVIIYQTNNENIGTIDWKWQNWLTKY